MPAQSPMPLLKMEPMALDQQQQQQGMNGSPMMPTVISGTDVHTGGGGAPLQHPPQSPTASHVYCDERSRSPLGKQSQRLCKISQKRAIPFAGSPSSGVAPAMAEGSSNMSAAAAAMHHQVRLTFQQEYILPTVSTNMVSHLLYTRLTIYQYLPLIYS